MTTVFTINFEGGRKSVVLNKAASLLSVLTPFCATRGLQIHGRTAFLAILNHS